MNARRLAALSTGAIVTAVLVTAACSGPGTPPASAPPEAVATPSAWPSADASAGSSIAVAPAASSAPVPPTASAPSTAHLEGEWAIRWDRASVGGKPAVLEGTLFLGHATGRWQGQLAFRGSSARATLDAARVDGERLEMIFTMAGSPDKATVRATVHEGKILGETQWGEPGWSPWTGRRPPAPRLESRSVAHGLPAAGAESAATDNPARKALLEHAAAEHSNAVILVDDGKVVLEKYREGYDGGPILAMSASKSLASLAVGMLIAEKRLTLDTRVESLLPEWKTQPEKSEITVRHLLTHTSGLDPTRARWSKESIREHAARSKLHFEPGTRFQYNNAAVDLLAVVFKQAAGVGLDAYLQKHLFQKLDTVGLDWMRDREGIPRAAGELKIRPMDLAKVGQVLLDGGKWRGEQLVPAEWLAQATLPQQPFDEACGFLFWREGPFATVLTQPILDGWRDAGADASLLEKAVPLLTRRHPDRPTYLEALRTTLGEDSFTALETLTSGKDHLPLFVRVAGGPSTGFSARGWLGQLLVVLPGKHRVAVRMRAWTPADAKGEERNAYAEFAADAAAL